MADARTGLIRPSSSRIRAIRKDNSFARARAAGIEGHSMHNTLILALLLAAGSCMQSFFAHAAEPTAQATVGSTAQSGKPWLGLHVLIYNAADLEKVRMQIPALAKSGVNVLILETDYNFEFASHPELNTGKGVTRQQAREIGDLCRKSGIRPIPQINCLGHQSWAKETGALLVKHPEFDETP